MSEEDEVDFIVAINQPPEGGLYFRVRWKGYTENDDTWEPEDHLSSCQEELYKFFRDVEGALEIYNNYYKEQAIQNNSPIPKPKTLSDFKKKRKHKESFSYSQKPIPQLIEYNTDDYIPFYSTQIPKPEKNSSQSPTQHMHTRQSFKQQQIIENIQNISTQQITPEVPLNVPNNPPIVSKQKAKRTPNHLHQHTNHHQSHELPQENIEQQQIHKSEVIEDEPDNSPPYFAPNNEFDNENDNSNGFDVDNENDYLIELEFPIKNTFQEINENEVIQLDKTIQSAIPLRKILINSIQRIDKVETDFDDYVVTFLKPDTPETFVYGMNAARYLFPDEIIDFLFDKINKQK